MEKKGFAGYRTAVGCFLCMFVNLGIPQGIGVFLPRIAEGLGEPIGKVSILITTATLVSFAVSFITPNLLKKLGGKLLLLIASILCTVHTTIYWLSPNVYWTWFAGAVAGLTMGWGANAVCSSILASWFIRKRGTVVGIVFSSAALGGAFFQFVGGRMCAAVGWRQAYLILGLAGGALAVLANIFLVRDPVKLGQKPLGWEEAGAKAVGGSADVVETGVPAKVALKSASFWMLFVGIVLGGFLITGFQSFAPSFWQENGMEAVKSSAYLSLYSLLGGAGVILGGVVADKLGNKGFLCYLIVAYILGLFCATRYGVNHSAFLVVLTCILVAISYPCSTSIPATVTTGAFGGLEYAKIVSYLMAALYLGKAIVSPVMSAIAAKTGGLMGGFVALMVIAAISLALCMLGIITSPMSKKGKKQ